jgi:hypothetical protein
MRSVWLHSAIEGPVRISKVGGMRWCIGDWFVCSSSHSSHPNEYPEHIIVNSVYVLFTCYFFIIFTDFYFYFLVVFPCFEKDKRIRQKIKEIAV